MAMECSQNDGSKTQYYVVILDRLQGHSGALERALESQIRGSLTEKYKYPNFAMETAFEYKYQIATETMEWNTSKQVSAKETALWNVYDYSRIIFFFFFKVE